MAFDLSIKTKILLWSDRHCCLCKKPCGVNIEVHHIVPLASGGTDDLENAIALCFDCHSEVGRYNQEHPKGNKIKPDELRARRDQVFEEFTKNLVPPIHYEITQQIPRGAVREFPDVGFVLSHFGDSLPVRVRSKICAVKSDGTLIMMPGKYSGEGLWHLNPRFLVSGHFTIPESVLATNQEVRLRIAVSIVDQYDREHSHLPVDYVYKVNDNSWYLD